MRKICILGRGPSHRLANALPDDAELWGMNMSNLGITRSFQRYFQMHDRMHHSMNGNPPGHFGRPLDHEEFLVGLDIPVYMQEVDPLIPTSVRYPIESVTTTIGTYLTSTAAYMLALALNEAVFQSDVLQIQLLGIYLQNGAEYQTQRPSVEYLIGVAKGLGIPVLLPDACPLTRAPLYAYETEGRGLRLESVTVAT